MTVSGGYDENMEQKTIENLTNYERTHESNTDWID